jgi:microcystin-dependent protein
MATVPTLQTAADLAASQIAGAASSFLPTGTVLPFAGSVAPTGWLLCNGSSVSQAVYADLFTVLGGASSPYGGVTGGNFNLPDCRGIFIAGAGTQTVGSKTYTKTLGSKQPEATARPATAFTTAAASVTGTTNSGNNISTALTGVLGATSTAYNWSGHALSRGTSLAANGGDGSYPGQTHTHDFTGTAAASSITGGGDAETRPANIAMNYIIKI